MEKRMRTNLLSLVLAAAFCLLPATSPVWAQDTSSAPSQAATEQISPEEQAFNARSAAMGERVTAYSAELRAAADRLASTPDAMRAELDRLQAQFQAEMDEFVQAFIDFSSWKESQLTIEERDRQRQGVMAMVPQLGAVPASVRQQVETAALAPAAPPSTAPQT